MEKGLQANTSVGISDEEFNFLYQKYFLSIKGYTYGFLKDDELAKDLAQNVFTKLYQHRKGITKSNIKNWLYKVAHNDVIDYLKRNPKQDYLELENQLRTEDTPLTAVQQQYEREMIFKVMLELPRNQRTAILLKDVKGFSYDEIAKTMQISLAAVKSLIFRGRKKFIKEYLEVKKNEV